MRTYYTANHTDQEIGQIIKEKDVWLQVFGFFIDYIPKNSDVVLYDGGFNYTSSMGDTSEMKMSGLNYEDVDAIFDENPALKKGYDFGYPRDQMRFMQWDSNGRAKHTELRACA